MTTSIKELQAMSDDDKIHRCFERLIDAAVLNLKFQAATFYQWQETSYNQSGNDSLRLYAE